MKQHQTLQDYISSIQDAMISDIADFADDMQINIDSDKSNAEITQKSLSSSANSIYSCSNE